MTRLFRRIASTALVLVLAVALDAQEGKTSTNTDRVPTDAGQVPVAVMENFKRDNPGIAGNWSRDGENFRVEFTDAKSRQPHVIIYDSKGTVLRREGETEQVPKK